MNTLVRGLITFVAVLVWGWISFAFNTVGPLVSGPVAGKQFDNTDGGYVVAQYGIRLFSWLGAMSTLAVLAVVVPDDVTNAIAGLIGNANPTAAGTKP